MLISFTFRGEFTYQANLRIELNLTNTFRETQDYYVKHYADPVQQARDSKMSYRCPDRIYTGLQPYQGCVPLGVLYPRAGTLGGCTQHHAMIMVHPWESDFDNIAQITGKSSWSAQTMRQYFVRLERNQYLPSSVVGHGSTPRTGISGNPIMRPRLQRTGSSEPIGWSPSVRQRQSVGGRPPSPRESAAPAGVNRHTASDTCFWLGSGMPNCARPTSA